MTQLMTPYGLVDLVTGDGMEKISVGAVIRKIAKMQRFGAHWYGALTVAQHSIAVNELLIREGADPDDTRGLVHDFGEYLTGDIPSPVIALSPEFADAHERLSELFVSKILGADYALSSSDVKEADRRIARAEMKALRFDGFLEHSDPVAEASVKFASLLDYDSAFFYYYMRGSRMMLLQW